MSRQPNTISDSANGLSLGYEFDAVGNLITPRTAAQTDPPVASYVYDALNRLSDVKDGPTGTVLDHYAYDATGNRTSFVAAGVTTPYTYPGTNHRLSQVGAVTRSYDNAGNTTQIGGTTRQFVYDDANRMSQVKAGATVTMSYVINGKGEQVRKYLGTTNTYTVYDESGHWLGDYDNAGAVLQQAIWMDDLPVGLMAANNTNYVEADALGSPRAVIDPTRDLAIWTWDLKGEPFGATVPNQNPDGDANSFVFNMRFPGQRADAASGLNYNYFRDYESSTGRYVQSDPIGLSGGISTYAYASHSPLQKIDTYGLQAAVPIPPNALGLPPIFQNQGPADSSSLDPADSYSSLMPKVSTSNQCPSDDCPPLIEKIESLVIGMNEKWGDLAVDKYDLYKLARYLNPGGALAGFGTWMGHVAKYQGLRTYLGALIRQAQNKGCQIPPNALETYYRPLPRTLFSPF